FSLDLVMLPWVFDNIFENPVWIFAHNLLVAKNALKIIMWPDRLPEESRFGPVQHSPGKFGLTPVVSSFAIPQTFMSQLILAVHPGIHDAAAAVLVDYDVKAAVQLERLTRFKGDGRTYPDLCIEELLDMVGATRRDVDVLALTRSDFPVR